MGVINAECQVFTPQNIVIEVLDYVGYKENLYGKKVLENSCGDGAFLIEIINRYILDCLNQKFTNEKIIHGLENDIYGAEIDIMHKKACIENMNKVVKKYNLGRVKWNIIQTDILKNPLKEKFQYIIGNPPYITYSDLSTSDREFIRKKFDVCLEGKPDYYYAFIELSIKALDKNGRLAYLIPNNIFKNIFANRIRDFMLPYLSKIIDYKSKKLFKSKLISSAVIICEGVQHENHVQYVDKVKNKELLLDKKSLKDKWIFSQIKQETKKEKRKFGDDFKAMCSIATLLNEAFILKEYDECDNYLLVKGFKIEKSILREAVSPKSLLYSRKEMLVFPYYYDDTNKLLRYEEDEFKRLFPETYKYLGFFSDKLDKRDKDENSKWFEYGRSQALAHLNQEKLLLSTVVTGKVNTYLLSRSEVPYAGICIYRKGEITLEFATEILKSKEFLNYVHNIGTNVGGTSIRITAKDIMNYEYTIG